MSELKKIFEIEGYDDGRKVCLDDVDGWFRFDGDDWRDEKDEFQDTMVGQYWNTPEWSLYKEPNDDIKEIKRLYGTDKEDILKDKINELVKKVNELSKGDK